MREGFLSRRGDVLEAVRVAREEAGNGSKPKPLREAEMSMGNISGASSQRHSLDI